MSRFITAFFAITLLFSTPSVFAQAPETGETLPPLVPSVSGGDATGPLNCFDYYTFGSVQADLQPTLAQTVPGSSLTFTGEVKSANSYPLLDGTLYVKIFKRNETTFAEGDGNEVVDQFVVKDGISLAANGTQAVSYDWKVPLNAEGGEYYAAYFFTTAKRYNLMGLSFTDDVVGNQAPFTITADNTITKLSKVDTTLNDRNHHFAAYPLHFAAGDTVTMKTTITNPGDTPKTLPLQWNQYAWDAMNKDNLRFTKTEVVTLAPNETKEVIYEAKSQRESVVYITAVAQDIEAKSILNIRYVRDGIEETRINFPGLTSFPLEKDKDATLFACAHSTNLPMVAGNILTLTLTDKDGNIIHQYKYEGDIAGAMSGFGESFKPAKNINYATLTATLERNGVTVEEVKQVYDCSAIDQTTCLSESSEDMLSFLDFFTKNVLTMVIGTVALLLSGITGFILYQKRRNHIDSGPTMTTPTALLFFLLILPSLFFVQSGVVEAKSVQWSWTDSSGMYYYRWDNQISGSNSGWAQALANPSGAITYNANLVNDATNQVIADGASVPIGTVFRVEPDTHQSADISWFGTGYTSDSPNGDWVVNAATPGDMPNSVKAGSCESKYYIGNNDVQGVQLYQTNCQGVTGEGELFGCDEQVVAFTLKTYIPLTINPPTKTYSATGPVTSLGGNKYQVNGSGSITATVTYAATYGRYYYRYHDDARLGHIGCHRDSADTPLSKSSSGSPSYQLTIPQKTITFTLTAVATNNPPNQPALTNCSVSGSVNTAYTFGMTATDPDNDTLRYGIDWDNNGTVDQWVPGSVYVNSGTSQSVSRTWTTAGTYSFRVLAQDSKNANSGWATCGANITAAPTPTADLKVNGSDGPIDVPKNTTLNLNWTSANAASCTKWGGSWGSGETVGTSGSDTAVVTATTQYMVNCGGTVDTVQVNVVNQTPNPPTITYQSGTLETGQTITFSIQGADPDNDNVFYEVDWDNNGTVDATTMTVPSNTAQNANRSWNTVGIVTFRARTVDTAGDRSGWTSHSETLAAPPAPSTTFDIQVNTNGWTTTNPTNIDTNDQVNVRWSSTNATGCTAAGPGFSTSDQSPSATSGTDLVTTPDPGQSSTYTLTCTGAGGTDTKSITVGVGLPNFTQPSITCDLSDTFDPATGEYDNIQISTHVPNNGVSGSKDTATLSMQFDSLTPVTTTFGALVKGGTSPTFTHTFNDISFGSHAVTVIADSTNVVAESNNADNTYPNYDCGGIPPPNPQINITADKVQLRNNESTVIRWSTAAMYPTLVCTISGPGIDINPAPLTGNRGTQPITAKSEYTFRCTETTTNTTWTDSVVVETQGTIEEI